ncbi:nucleoside hydrolase [Lacrimispora sp.]|jgi:pyrimidine-specific ribonucleoside hydrolase|uniref:nucleoside hydrolase n=1 Tax=Lacrimispora sp. TaxID=2719234 RepID=UPI002858EDED|nr:nucleoside hydrolase [Lacrimispora sp.]MDR7814844.1 nucleoside hydrolase [Lacrimispora sp.]
METSKKVWIDCDPGIDDSFALLLAMKHLSVVGISAVGGNTGLDHTFRNARYVTELAGHGEIPVYAGYDMPMFAKPERAEYVHGSSGLGNIMVPSLKGEQQREHAVDALIDAFRCQTDMTLVTLGPLTNVAQALLKEPELKHKIPEIISMGGSVTTGNYNACAEFNIAVDPEAAKIVYESGIPIRMVGLNLCRQNSMTIAEVEQLKALPGLVAAAAADLLEYSVNQGRQSQLCDACAIAWLIDPAIITCALPMHVDVETKGEFTRGMTVCDYRDYIGMAPKEDIGREVCYPVDSSEKNVLAAMEFDKTRFKELLIQTIKSYEV